MRIDRLDLLAFGPFKDKTLDFSAGSQGLHLVYGDNEAGKSTSLRALIAWLFGIPARTGDSYLFSNRQLRIGGKLRLSSGHELEFLRRKGNKDTLLAPVTEDALDDSVLEPFIPGGIDEAFFSMLYGIDHHRLTEGGRELLNQSGDLGQALFSAAVGTAGLRNLRDELQDGADELYRPRASTKVVNQAIAGYREARQRVKENSLKVSAWKTLQREHGQAVKEIREIETEINRLSMVKSRLERSNRVKGALAERRNLVRRLEELGEVLLLPEDFGEACKKALADLETAGEAKKKAEARLSRLRAEAASLHIRPELLDSAETIASLYREMGAVEKAAADRPLQDGKRRQLREEAAKLLKSVRPGLNLDQVDTLRPLLNNRKWLTTLAGNYNLLNQEREKSEAEMERTAAEQQALQQEYSGLAKTTLDPVALKAVAAAARRPGDIEERLSGLEKSLRDKLEECEKEFSRLGRFSGTLEALGTAAMPLSETVDRYEKELDALAEQHREAERLLKQHAEEQKKAERELQALLLKGAVPIQQDLDRARESRNRGWALVKNRYIDNLEEAAEIEAYTGGADLVGLYEQKIETADNLADQLRRAADEVVKRADLEAAIKDHKTRLAGLEEEKAGLEAQRENLLERWHALWLEAGVTPGEPREMKQWLLKAEHLAKNCDGAGILEAEAQKLAGQCQELKQGILLQVAGFNAAAAREDLGLEALITLCEEEVDKEEDKIARRRQLEHNLAVNRQRLERLQEALQSVHQKQAAWQKEWSQAVSGLGVDPSLNPAHALERFENLQELVRKYDESDTLRRRIWGIDQGLEEFREKVYSFIKSIGVESGGEEVTGIVARLNGDLNAAREARAGLKRIEEQQKEVKEEIENASITMERAGRQLADLRKKAGVKSNDQLEAAAEGSNQKRELQNNIDRLEGELSRHGDGLNIEALEDEASKVDIDMVGAELEKVEAGLKELQEKRDALRDERQTLQHRISEYDGSAAAAEASAEAEQQLAVMQSGIEEYLRLQIAALILGRHIEEYRQKNQAPLLSRAGELFSRLTLGSFKGLRDELGPDENPILLGIRPGNEELTVDAMSDGTRDQLYLALRLATLEQHLQHGEIMPFIVDDILIGFDDSRTKVSLKVLAGLALTTQVLIFTHHRRVAELAAALDEPAGIFIHELN